MGTALENLIDDPRIEVMDTPACREGDWEGYRRAVTQPGPLVGPHAEADAMDYKRRCAIEYLGKRALAHGGVCSRTVPRVLTQKFAMNLEKSNRTIRYARYPWLEQLMKLIAEIEAIQEKYASNNVITLVKKPIGH